MFRKRILIAAGAMAGLALLAVLAYRLPPVHQRLSWRLDLATTYLRGVIYPADQMPKVAAKVDPAAMETLPPPAVHTTRVPTSTPAGGTPAPSPTPTPTLPPLPPKVSLEPPAYEQQDMNNCGPATLSLNLRALGWSGTQFDVAKLVKPIDSDRNVNVEELVYYVRTRVGWLNVEYRVGGTLETLKRVLAAGLPVMIEETFVMDAPYWPNDDLWAGHYLLLTGYDDATQTFTTQDTYYGPNLPVPYDELYENWKSFNRVYILLYPPDREEDIKTILGSDWDVDTNREHALEQAQAETLADPRDALAWFNVGTNLVYFERYNEAALAYDTAREIGLPQRMLRYQFGPFIAYFHAGRTDDLMALTDYALKRTPNSEETLVWRAWGLYRQGKTQEAIVTFRRALEAHPGDADAIYGLNYLGGN